MRAKRAGLWCVGAGLAALAVTPGASAQVLKQAAAPATQLERADSNELPGGAVASRYDQEVGGVPVVGAGAVVLDAPAAPAEIVADNSVQGLGTPGAPSVSRDAAVAAALAAIGGPSGGSTDARLVVDATHGNQLAWEVSHWDTAPPRDWVVNVAARSGTVISKVDLLRNATGTAALFVPNPVVANDGYGGLRDRGDRDSGALSSLRQTVPLQDLADGQTCLKGDWAGVKYSPKPKQVCKDSLDWGNTKRASNRFEALMAYHHITEAQQYIQGLGLDPVNAERQNVIANPIPDDNSFYLPSADEIQLGTGGVDDGEDADVIVHEYGHAVQDAQAPDAFRTGGNQVGAMGEGFGDYLAAAYSTEKAGPDPEWTPCIMEWDATSYDDRFTPPPGICLRRADDPSSRQQQQNQCGTAQDIHCMGQIWSSALLDLRIELGLDAESDSVADTLVLASHFLLPENPSFEDAAGAILDADGAIYGGTHCVALGTEFEDRGFGQFVAAC